MRVKNQAPGRYGMYAVALFSAAFLEYACTQQSLEPVAPTWDTDLTLPLANRTYTLADIVAKNPGSLRADAGNQIVFSSSSQTSPTAVGDLLTLNPEPSTQRFKLGAFSVMFPQLVVPVPFPFTPGAEVPIPVTTVSVPDLTTPVGTFQSITVNTGTVSLTLHNHLPVAVRVVNSVTLLSNALTVAVFSFTGHDVIPPNDSTTSSSDLAGKTVDNTVTLSGLVLETSPSLQPVRIPDGAAFDFTVATRNLSVSRAVNSIIPPQQLTNNDTTRLGLDDSTIVSYAKISTGSINLAITNHIQLDILFKYRFADVWHVVGGVSVPFEDSIRIPAGGTLNRSANLGNCEIHSQPTGALVDSLRTVSSVIIPAAASNVTVHDTDRVVVTVSQGIPMIADSVAGILKPTTVNVNRSFALNLGDVSSNFNGHLNIPRASLGLNIVSTIGSPMDVNLTMRARSRTGGMTATLAVPSVRVNQGSTPISFDSSAVGDFLSRLTGGLPDSIQLLGSVLVNPQYDRSLAGIRHVGRKSSVAGDAHLDVPLTLGIVGNASYADTVALDDPNNSGYRDFVDKAQTDQFNAGSIFMEVSNGTPVQVDVSLRWLDSARGLILFLPQNGDTVHIAPGTVDAGGNVIAPAQSTSVIQLNADQAKKFSKAAFFSKSLMLMTAGGSPAVKFRTTDFVSVRVWSKFTATVSK